MNRPRSGGAGRFVTRKDWTDMAADQKVLVIGGGIAGLSAATKLATLDIHSVIVEKAPIKTFYKNPAHPYSQGLIRSLPVLGRKVEQLYSIKGQPPGLLNLPPGCRFAPRCEQVKDICHRDYPPEIDIEDGHRVSCWLYQET